MCPAYGAAGAVTAGLLGAAEVFCLAILARASRIVELLPGAGAEGAAAGGLLCSDAKMLLGGLPGGVVVSSTHG
jgi:hypothetical protein